LCVKKEINPSCCGILIHGRYGSVVGKVACRDMCIAGSQELEFRHSRVQNRRNEDIPIARLGFLFPNQEGKASRDGGST
jgi:hypothetical protein